MKAKNKNFMRKLSQLLAGLFVAVSSITSVQAAELVKVESIKSVLFTTQAITNIEQQFNLLSLNYSTAEQNAEALLVQAADSFNVDFEMTLAKTSVLAE